MKTIALLLICLFVSATAHADDWHPDPWRTSDTVRQSVYFGLHFIDYLQTSYVVAHSDEFQEKASAYVIGEHPSQEAVNVYFIAGAAANQAIAYFLPYKWREAFQYSNIVVKVIAVEGNFSIGIKIPID